MAGNRLPPQPLQNTKVAIKKTFGPPEKPQNIKLPNLPGGIFEEFDEYQCGGYGHEDQFSSEVIENQVP